MTRAEPGTGLESRIDEKKRKEREGVNGKFTRSEKKLHARHINA
jgi:hypothetical protein